MRIEELVLHGFKSFAERTVLPLVPGVTAVVGPNGSGKSNLVEAIRFVVGARTRRLRGVAASDLVFQGAPGRRPAGFAEVRLRLLGERRHELYRRLYRDGRQEVRLDGQRASLKELALALAGTGLGPGGTAIIGQGQVAGVLDAPPEQLLTFLIEAAGLSEVEARMQEARTKLAAARARMAEEEERLARLEETRLRLSEAARAAKRARELELLRLALRRGILADREREARQAARAARERAQAARERARRAHGEAVDSEEEAAFLARRYEAGRTAETRLKELGSVLEAEWRGLAARRSLAERNLELLRQRQSELSRRIAGLPPRPQGEDPEEDPAELRQELAELEAERDRIRRRLQEAERAWRSFLEAEARYRAAEAAYREALHQRASEARKLWALERSLSERLPRLRRAEEQARSLRSRRQSLERELGTIEADLAALHRERERIERALAEGRGLSEGPKRLIRARLAGVVGTVATLLELAPELKAAAEAALGGRLSWVVVEDEAALRRAVAWLKERGLRATLLARSLARPPREHPVPPCPGVQGRLRDVVRFPRDERLTRTVVGETLLAADLDAALECFKRHPRRIVTQEGELLEPSGAISGGRPQRHGLLELPLRLRELDAEIEALKTARAKALSELERLAAREPDLAHLRREVDDLFREVELIHRLLNRPLPPPPDPPTPVPEPDRSALLSLEEKARQIAAKLERAEAFARYRLGEAERPQLEAELAAVREEIAAAQEEARRIAEASGRIHALRGRLRRLSEMVEATLSDLARARERVLASAARARKQEARALAEAEEAEVEAVRREAQAEAFARELAELPPGPVAEGGISRLRSVERELADLGPVNFRAEVELAEVEESYRAQAGILAEAQKAVERLGAFLAELGREFEHRMEASERRLATAFADYVRGLLGGEGRIRREGDGLVLEIAPAGKRVRDLRLFSTGEKTMGALALLFALAEVREGGLPIAVLDEVDAALDEANLARFVRFLKDFKRGRQVLIVTHQKRTLEAADAVVGITSLEGVSRIYTLKRDGNA